MGKIYDLIDEKLASWLGTQKIFVVSGLRLHPLVDRLANLGLCNRGRMGSWSTRRDLGNLELRFRRQCNGHRERHHAEGISFLNRFQSSV